MQIDVVLKFLKNPTFKYSYEPPFSKTLSTPIVTKLRAGLRTQKHSETNARCAHIQCAIRKLIIFIYFLFLSFALLVFEFARKECQGSEIHRNLLAKYGDRALSRRSVHEWFWTSVMDIEGTERPSTSTTDEKIQQSWEMNRRIFIELLEGSL